MSIIDQVLRIEGLVHGNTGSLESKTVAMGIANKGDKLKDINDAIQGIPIRTASSIDDTTPAAGQTVTIPYGYYNSNVTITPESLSLQTPGTATANEILSEKTAWVNGSEVIGSIQSFGGQTVTPTNTRQTVSITGKYNTGDVIVEPVNYYYTGSQTPSDSVYNDGDIFLVIE